MSCFSFTSCWNYVKVEIYLASIILSKSAIASWILLFNSSHLQGTFDAENFWLARILSRPSRKRVFLEALHSDDARRHAEAALDAENYYSLHRYIGQLLIEDDKRNNRISASESELFSSIFDAYDLEGPESTRLSLAKDVFQSIRLLSFTTLDLNHSALGVRIVPHLILQQILNNPERLLGYDYASLDEQLNALQPILFQQIYASRDAILNRAQHWDHQQLRYRRLRKQHGRSWFWGSTSSLAERLRNALTTELGITSKPNPYIHLFRIELFDDLELQIRKILPLTLERRLSSKTKQNAIKYIITPTSSLNSRGALLDVTARSVVSRPVQSRILWAVAAEVYSHYHTAPRFHSYDVEDGATAWEQLFLVALNKFLLDSVTATINHVSSPENFLAEYLQSKSRFGSWSKARYWSTRRAALDEGRTWEIECLRRSIRNEAKGPLLVCLGRVVLSGDGRRPLGDFDVAYLRLSARTTELIVGECKSGETAKSRKAQKELKSLLESVTAHPDLTIEGSGQFAWCRLNLDTVWR